MQRLVNNPKDYVNEMLEGLYLAHSNEVSYINNDLRCMVSNIKKQGKVGLVTGGGSGHLPLFLGYVGEGLLDACAIGGVFQSPSTTQILEVTKNVDSGAGVLYIYGNYGGDIMNFDMAKELAEVEHIKVAQVVAGEDVASAPKEMKDKRRGVAGIYFVFKIAGAAADTLLSLEEVTRIANKAANNVGTMGVALSACTIPEVGKPGFSIAEGEMELGMGIHGEPGIEKSPLKSADFIVEKMVNAILQDLECEKNQEVAVLVNGLGATPLEELYILYRSTHHILQKKGISIFQANLGEYATSMDMAGASISILKVDDELKKYLSMPCKSPFIKS